MTLENTLCLSMTPLKKQGMTHQSLHNFKSKPTENTAGTKEARRSYHRQIHSKTTKKPQNNATSAKEDGDGDRDRLWHAFGCATRCRSTLQFSLESNRRERRDHPFSVIAECGASPCLRAFLSLQMVWIAA